MITKLFLKNFKPFAEQELDFKNLTILSGLNSTGKSSVLQSLLLLRQSFEQKLLNETGLALNGDLVSIGTAKDALWEFAKEDVLGFKINNNELSGEWYFNYEKESDVMELDKIKTLVKHEIYKSSLFNDNFHYIQAERLGPRRYFEISEFQVNQHRQIGSQGQYAAYFLNIYEDTKIIDSSLAHSDTGSLKLKDQVEAWMSEISPGTRVKIKTNPEMDIVNLQYSYGLSNDYRSTNVGFGITYVLPILVAILSAKPDTLILLENPEAHLHPKGQSKMGRLLALAANCGIQIIVETHSDHLLNGIRVAVREKLAKADIAILNDL